MILATKVKKEPIVKISDRIPRILPNQLVFLHLATRKKPKKCTTMKKLTKPV